MNKFIILILLIITFTMIMDRVFIKLEEDNLRKKFGEEYILYKNKVRRWI